MRIKKLGFLLLIFVSLPFFSEGQSILKSDSLALIALYESTSGNVWRTSWDTNLPVVLWEGVEVVDGRVTSIQLTANELQGRLPENMGDLTELETINLSGNRLYGPLPNSLFDLRKLTMVNLSDNSFSGSLPMEISRLRNLKILFLGRNQFNGTIPPELGQLINLEMLDIGSNQIFGLIPEELGNLSRLRVFSAENNQLEGTIPDSFLKLRPTLQIISLNDNLIEPSVLEKWNKLLLRR
jgi:Leucine-rich repeat (LRR) protein